MRSKQFLVLVAMSVACVTAHGQDKPSTETAKGPTDAKAKQTFADATKLMNGHKYLFAMEGFRKADKQDGGHCLECELQAYLAAGQAGEFKVQREEAAAMVANTSTQDGKARAHFLAGKACLTEGLSNNHEKPFETADGEFKAALEIKPDDRSCLYQDAVALAHLKQDGAARERFQQFMKVTPQNNPDYARAQRFADHPELARGRVAPNFSFTALDGSHLSLESLTGKVVLIDFWATWCGPCREALPHVKEIAKKFAGQPLVVISISMDSDDTKWKDFVEKNGMTWLQYRDGRFEGPVARMFAVNAIPATFTIDADGLLQDQHVGDADIEGKIKKLVARAAESANKNAVARGQ